MNSKKGLSLICATYNRTQEVRRLMESLKFQTNQDFELILIDQNGHHLIEALVNEFKGSMALQYYRQDELNSSKARNFGAKFAKYYWLGFPDDDCWYPNDFVEKFLNKTNNQFDGIFINWSDPASQPPKIRFEFQEGLMIKKEAFSLVSCICLFIKKSSFHEIGGFNENLGLGSTPVIKAGEEQELTLRFLQRNAHIYKYPLLKVHHALNEREWDDAFRDRIISQGACDFLFAKKFNSPVFAYGLVLKWLAGIAYNTLRARKQNICWYYLKLKGAFSAPADI